MDKQVSLLKNKINASGIKFVAIVDDVFDTPSIGNDNMGSFLEFLQKGEETRVLAEIEKNVWDSAIKDIGTTDYTSDSVAEVLEKLYQKYVHADDARCDPNGMFKNSRGANLVFLRPLLELLRSCESILVQTFGSETTAIDKDKMPDVILVDLYLDPNISPVGHPNVKEAQAAIVKSMTRVKPLLANEPAIILMSSHGEKGKQEADNYRAQLNNRIYGSRFGFVDKGQIIKHPENGLIVQGAACETLLDIFQTYKFGKALSEAMTRWQSSAKQAIDTMWEDVRGLQLKEIAYLIQFRLATEGQSLEEYLEWLFGEALLDYIVRENDKAHAGNSLELAFDPVAVMGIDGGFEPTKNVAKMYHRVRIESVRNRPRKNFRLGDLYRDKTGNKVFAVMTPDCDLVLRKSKKKEVRNAEHLLLVPGLISDLEETSASVGDFLMIGETPHNIQWIYKKVFSLPFSGTLEKAGQSGADYEYLGTLRPLYAQEIQANLINHIGRVGVAVPPLIGLPAVATIVVRTNSTLKDIAPFNCALIPSRASDQKHRVVFDRKIIQDITTTLLDMSTESLISGSAEKIKALKEENGESIELALKRGPEIGLELSKGIMLTEKRDGTVTGPWCAICISQAPIQADALSPPVQQPLTTATSPASELTKSTTALPESKTQIPAQPSEVSNSIQSTSILTTKPTEPDSKTP